jgi:hypothetical protein
MPPDKGIINIELVATGSPEAGDRCDMSDSGGVGSSFGAMQPPKLVNYRGNNL